MSKSHGWGRMVKMQLPNYHPGHPAQMWSKGDCRVLITNDPAHGKIPERLHLSISCADRYPTWEEIKDARYNLLPLGQHFAMILPPPGEYVNVHPNCFHLLEIPAEFA